MTKTTPSTIGETACGYKIYAFECNGDEPCAIWVGWEDKEPKPYYVTTLYDRTIAIEFDGSYAEYIYYEYYGDTSLMKFDQKHSKGARPMPYDKALHWLETFRKTAYVTEETIVWDNISQAYYEGNDLPDFIFWSESIGWYAGPGHEEGTVDYAIANPEAELWPYFDEAGVDAVRDLKDCLLAGHPRVVDPDYPLKPSPININNEFGCTRFGAPFLKLREYESPVHNLETRDGFKWLSSLSKPDRTYVMRAAERSTVEQIDLWLKSKLITLFK